MNASLPSQDDATSTAHGVREPPAAGSCQYCGSRGMRRSKWRSEDFWQLFALHWPMRCMECRKRQYGTFASARHAVPAGLAHSGAFKAQQTWRHYTGRRNPADDSLTMSGVRLARLHESKRKAEDDKDAA